MAWGFSSLAITGVSLTGRGDDLFDGENIGSAADKGNRHRIHVHREPECEILFVLGGERGHAQHRSRQVDSLMLAQQSAVDHLA